MAQKRAAYNSTMDVYLGVGRDLPPRLRVKGLRCRDVRSTAIWLPDSARAGLCRGYLTCDRQFPLRWIRSLASADDHIFNPFVQYRFKLMGELTPLWYLVSVNNCFRDEQEVYFRHWYAPLPS